MGNPAKPLLTLLYTSEVTFITCAGALVAGHVSDAKGRSTIYIYRILLNATALALAARGFTVSFYILLAVSIFFYAVGYLLDVADINAATQRARTKARDTTVQKIEEAAGLAAAEALTTNRLDDGSIDDAIDSAIDEVSKGIDKLRPLYFVGCISIVNWILDRPGAISGGGILHAIILILNILFASVLIFVEIVYVPLKQAWGCYDAFQSGRIGIEGLEFGTCPQWNRDNPYAEPLPRVFSSSYPPNSGLNVGDALEGGARVTNVACSQSPAADAIFDGPRRAAIMFLCASAMVYVHPSIFPNHAFH